MNNDEVKAIYKKLFAGGSMPVIVKPITVTIVDGARVVHDATGRWVGTFGEKSWKAMQEHYNKDTEL